MRPATQDVVETDYEIVDPHKRPRKYGPGEPLRRLEEIDDALHAKAMLWHRHKPTHAAWVHNLSYGYLKAAMRNGYIRWAVVTEEYKAWLRRESAEVAS